MATTANTNGRATHAPAAVVVEFLQALEAGDIGGAMELLAEDAVWINVSLPTVKGRRRIETVCRATTGRGARFRVHVHHIAADGDVVLTERSDALGLGRFEQRFWVHGRFEVRGGRIVVWRDAFDYRDYLVSVVRGLAGALLPGLNRSWPLPH